MQVCQEALELNGRLISTDQLLYHDDLKTKYHGMEETLSVHLNTDDKVTVTACMVVNSLSITVTLVAMLSGCYIEVACL